MTDTPDTAAARVADYLDASDRYGRMRPDLIDTAAAGGGRRARLTATDLRAVLAEHQQMRDELARYTDRYQEWGVRLTGGTHINCHGEEDAREKARAYHGTVRVCDILSTDWRDADPTPDASRLVGGWQPADEAPAQRDLNLPQGQE